ncbi:EpsG family protein [Providencia rettgeri]
MITTYIIYNLTLLFGSFFAFLSQYCKNKKASLIFLSLSFIIVFLIAAIRYDIGTDYKNYVEIFKNLDSSSEYLEISFIFIASILKSNNIDVQFLFVVFSFISLLFVYLASRNSNKFLFITAFILILYFQSFSAIRQISAICIALYAFSYLISNRPLQFLVWLIISTTFHFSTIILLPFILLSKVRLNNIFFLMLTISLSIAILYFDVSNKILSLDILAQTKYASYIGSQFNSETKLGSGLGVILKITYPFLVLIITLNKKDRLSNYIFSTMMIYVICILLSAKIHIFNRLPPIFSIVIPFSICYVYSKKSKYRQLFVFSFFFIYLFLYELDINISQSHLNSGLGISPYQTILEKN